ncbi:MAG: rhomboid family intramembrane serine protease [Verrucomicrobiota bacterium]|nr:rhomboid family intramembrane serine protease [Verrucomicrobiota bacterium]
MGYADRDYFRETSGRPPGRLAGAPVVKWLLIINLGVFAVALLLDFREASVEFGKFTMREGIRGFQVWRLITFQFLHGDFGHLLFNSIAIYFFGAFVEQQLRSRAFLVFYLLCGVAGALGYAALVSISDNYRDVGVVGASGGIFGILVVAAMIAPDMRVQLLFPPVTLTMRLMAILMLGWGVLVVVTGGQNAGGEAGHLGGALAGFLLWKVPAFRGLLANLGRSGGRGPGKRPAFRIRITKSDKPYEKKLRPKSRVSGTEAGEVDRILDKINEQGLQSLTGEERELLAREGRK